MLDMIPEQHRYSDCPLCYQSLSDWQRDFVKEKVNRMNRRENGRIKSYQHCGRLEAFIAVALIGLFVWMVVSSLWILIAVILAIYFGLPMIKEQSKMKDVILRITGIRIINMKLSALAEYLKIRFIHVPEHYKCEEINK